jgi:hypothetical protein
LKQVALKGGDAPVIAGGRFANFTSVSLQDGQILFIATLEHGSGTNAGNDRGAPWVWNIDFRLSTLAPRRR